MGNIRLVIATATQILQVYPQSMPFITTRSAVAWLMNTTNSLTFYTVDTTILAQSITNLHITGSLTHYTDGPHKISHNHSYLISQLHIPTIPTDDLVNYR